MAKSKLPNPLEQRHLLVKELPSAQALQLAESFREVGRRPEAVLFYAKAEATDELESLRGEAIETGDAFLLKLVSERQDREPTADEWTRLGASASATGKERYAAVAARQAEVAPN